MNINWKVRFKNKYFWVCLIPALIVLIKNILKLVGIDFDFTVIQERVLDVIEAVFVVLFYRVGEMFEDYAVKKSRKSISEVMNICPDYTNLLVDGKTERVDPDEVDIGDMIVVGVGERVALDGKVTEGSGEIDTTAITGESMPVFAEKNLLIRSGSINLTVGNRPTYTYHIGGFRC